VAVYKIWALSLNLFFVSGYATDIRATAFAALKPNPAGGFSTMILLRTGALVSLMVLGLGSAAEVTLKPDFKGYPALNVVEYRKHLESNLPDFKQYPARATFTGKPAKVVLDTPEAKQFRTRLREAAKRPADFAGEYVLAGWGCGTSCEQGAAVNLRTGHVVFLPGSVCCNGDEEERTQYRKDSRLWIAYGRVNEGDPYGRHYYEFTGREFKLVRTVPMEDTYMKDFGPRMRKGLEEAMRSIGQKRAGP